MQGQNFEARLLDLQERVEERLNRIFKHRDVVAADADDVRALCEAFRSLTESKPTLQVCTPVELLALCAVVAVAVIAVAVVVAVIAVVVVVVVVVAVLLLLLLPVLTYLRKGDLLKVRKNRR